MRWIFIGIITTLFLASLAHAESPSVNDANAGLEALDKGDYGTAIQLLTQALREGGLSKSDRELAFLTRAKAYIGKQQYDPAESDLSTAARLDPKDGDVTNVRSQIPMRYSVELRHGVSVEEGRAIVAAVGAKVINNFSIANVFLSVRLTAEQAASLKNNPAVASVDTDQEQIFMGYDLCGYFSEYGVESGYFTRTGGYDRGGGIPEPPPPPGSDPDGYYSKCDPVGYYEGDGTYQRLSSEAKPTFETYRVDLRDGISLSDGRTTVIGIGGQVLSDLAPFAVIVRLTAGQAEMLARFPQVRSVEKAPPSTPLNRR
ncbi:MAG: tetratricopeptide repeat protein [Alphaproteobacteria bacterium]|nr:tetratricopeptide repeat protein [Alphaproteobacteria bacterium]